MTAEKQIILEKQFVAGVTAQRMRIYDYLVGKFEIISTRKGIKKALQRNQILLNGAFAKSGDYIKNGDRIELIKGNKLFGKNYEIDLDVIYEDDEIAIVVKPAGLVVSGNRFKTLQNALTTNLKESGAKDKLSVPLTAHRLDAQTFGLVIVAKTYSARIKIGEYFENREIRKKYIAIVQGSLEGSGTLNSPVQGKDALTSYISHGVYPSVKNNFISLLELEPFTGRKHQLRIHLSRLGFPIIGDKLYSRKGNVLPHKGLFLAAVSLSFLHPSTKKELAFEISYPTKFDNFIDKEARWVNRINERNE